MAEVLNLQVSGVRGVTQLVGKGDTDLLGNDTMASINDLMVILGVIKAKMRDITKQMEQPENNPAFKKQVDVLNIQMQAIEKISGADLKIDDLMYMRSTADKMAEVATDFHANDEYKKKYEQRSLADSEKQFDDALEKNRENHLSQALQVSALMKEFTSALVEVHNRISSQT